jgi:hypothetical protein
MPPSSGLTHLTCFDHPVLSKEGIVTLRIIVTTSYFTLKEFRYMTLCQHKQIYDAGDIFYEVTQLVSYSCKHVTQRQILFNFLIAKEH